ncbi:MAG: hypothetical protein H0V80_13045 [Acidobacteria bacterium]|nr:hypothetical protein [Acidobacteriota bacterium]
MHQVDITKLVGLLARLVSGRRRRLSGDADFDQRCLVIEDGVPVRDGWLDAATRKEIARFVDEAPLPGTIWIHDGALVFIMRDPWTGIDGPVVRALLERQGGLASALERTAGVSS